MPIDTSSDANNHRLVRLMVNDGDDGDDVFVFVFVVLPGRLMIMVESTADRY